MIEVTALLELYSYSDSAISFILSSSFSYCLTAVRRPLAKTRRDPLRLLQNGRLMSGSTGSGNDTVIFLPPSQRRDLSQGLKLYFPHPAHPPAFQDIGRTRYHNILLHQ